MNRHDLCVKDTGEGDSQQNIGMHELDASVSSNSMQAGMTSKQCMGGARPAAAHLGAQGLAGVDKQGEGVAALGGVPRQEAAAQRAQQERAESARRRRASPGAVQNLPHKKQHLHTDEPSLDASTPAIEARAVRSLSQQMNHSQE